jgi:integrase
MIDAITKQVESTSRDFPICPWLSQRRGDRIVGMRPAWPAASTSVGLDGLLFHDLRRSAVRNIERAGISREVAKKISGHKTDSAYRRYNIVSGPDMEDAGETLAACLERQK